MDNRRIEQSVLGCGLLFPEYRDKIKKELSPNNFTLTPAKTLMRKLLELPATVDIADDDFAQECITLADLQQFSLYCKMIRDASISRADRLKKAGTSAKSMEQAIAAGNLEKAIGIARSIVSDGAATAKTFRSASFSESLADFKASLTQPPAPKLKTGFPLLDYGLSLPLDNGNLVVVGARSSVGKTAITTQMAVAMAKQNHKVIYYSLETSTKIMTQRIIAQQANVPYRDVESHTLDESQMKRIDDAIKELSTLDFEVVAASGASTDDLIMDMTQKKPDVVIIDHLGIVIQSGQTRNDETRIVSNRLHDFAQRSGITIFGLSQLNKIGYQEFGKVNTSNLKDSSALIEDADVIILVDRNVEGKTPEEKRDTIVKIEKNKNGPTGKFNFSYYGEVMKFYQEDVK